MLKSSKYVILVLIHSFLQNFHVMHILLFQKRFLISSLFLILDLQATIPLELAHFLFKITKQTFLKERGQIYSSVI